MPKPNRRKFAKNSYHVEYVSFVTILCYQYFVCLLNSRSSSILFLLSPTNELFLFPSVWYNSLNESKPDWRWQLTASGRFAHRKEYATKVGLAHGLTLIHYEKLDGFRHDHGKDVRGHLFVMQKGSSHKKDEL